MQQRHLQMWCSRNISFEICGLKRRIQMSLPPNITRLTAATKRRAQIQRFNARLVEQKNVMASEHHVCEFTLLAQREECRTRAWCSQNIAFVSTGCVLKDSQNAVLSRCPVCWEEGRARKHDVLRTSRCPYVTVMWEGQHEFKICVNIRIPLQKSSRIAPNHTHNTHNSFNSLTSTDAFSS